MLEARGLRQDYAGRTVLDVGELRLEPGTRLAVVGPNGAGKSTLLRVLAFLEPPAAGTLLLDGRPVATDSERHAARRRVTMVEQRPFLFRGGVLDNVAWGLLARGEGAGAHARALAALDLVASRTLAGREAQALSEGEVQRVAAARALALEPAVLLLDEPTSGADAAARQALTAAITAAQAARPMSVCVASHQLEEVWRWTDRLLALQDGRPVSVTP